jgi:hypothetical protein
MVATHPSIHPPTQPGFDEQAFLAACAGERDEAFNSAKGRQRSFPPNGTYLCKLVGSRFSQTSAGDPTLALAFVVADGPQEQFRFEGFWVAATNRMGIIKTVLKTIYDGVKLPTKSDGKLDLGLCLLGCRQLVAANRYYRVTVKTTDPNYNPNVYINRHMAAEESESSE